MIAWLCEVWCTFAHTKWQREISYAGRYRWRCEKPGCQAQKIADERNKS